MPFGAVTDFVNDNFPEQFDFKKDRVLVHLSMHTKPQVCLVAHRVEAACTFGFWDHMVVVVLVTRYHGVRAISTEGTVCVLVRIDHAREQRHERWDPPHYDWDRKFIGDDGDLIVADC